MYTFMCKTEKHSDIDENSKHDIYMVYIVTNISVETCHPYWISKENTRLV